MIQPGFGNEVFHSSVNRNYLEVFHLLIQPGFGNDDFIEFSGKIQP